MGIDKLEAAPKEALVIDEDTNTETLVDEGDTNTETLVGDDSMAETLVIEDTNTETLDGDGSMVEAIVIEEDTNTETLADDDFVTDSLIVEDITAETHVVEDTTAGDDASIEELLNEARREEAAKREEEKDWTLVDKRKGGRPKSVPKPADVKNMLSEPTIKPKAPLPLLSKEAIAGKHFYTSKEYEKSREYRVLMAIINECLKDLKKKTRSLENPIRKAICLGIGSFDPPNGSWVSKERAHLQLAAFFAILDAIRKCLNLCALDFICGNHLTDAKCNAQRSSAKTPSRSSSRSLLLRSPTLSSSLPWDTRLLILPPASMRLIPPLLSSESTSIATSMPRSSRMVSFQLSLLAPAGMFGLSKFSLFYLFHRVVSLAPDTD
jgi:hypothetical protein